MILETSQFIWSFYLSASQYSFHPKNWIYSGSACSIYWECHALPSTTHVQTFLYSFDFDIHVDIGQPPINNLPSLCIIYRLVVRIPTLTQLHGFDIEKPPSNLPSLYIIYRLEVLIPTLTQLHGWSTWSGWVHHPDLQFHKSKHCSRHTMLRAGSEKIWKVSGHFWNVFSSSSCLIRRMALQWMTN